MKATEEVCGDGRGRSKGCANRKNILSCKHLSPCFVLVQQARNKDSHDGEVYSPDTSVPISHGLCSRWYVIDNHATKNTVHSMCMLLFIV